MFFNGSIHIRVAAFGVVMMECFNLEKVDGNMIRCKSETKGNS